MPRAPKQAAKPKPAMQSIWMKTPAGTQHMPNTEVLGGIGIYQETGLWCVAHVQLGVVVVRCYTKTQARRFRKDALALPIPWETDTAVAAWPQASLEALHDLRAQCFRAGTILLGGIDSGLRAAHARAHARTSVCACVHTDTSDEQERTTVCPHTMTQPTT